MTYYSRYRPCRLSLQKRAQSHSSCSGGWSGANSIIVTYSSSIYILLSIIYYIRVYSLLHTFKIIITPLVIIRSIMDFYRGGASTEAFKKYLISFRVRWIKLKEAETKKSSFFFSKKMMIFCVYEIGFRSRDAFRGHGSRPTGRWSGKRCHTM